MATPAPTIEPVAPRVAGAFSYSGALPHVAALGSVAGLADGSVVLAAGTGDGTSGLRYWPAGGRTEIADLPLEVSLSHAVLVSLADGRALLAGGSSLIGSTFTPTPSAFTFDPASLTWQQVGDLQVARSGHTGTLLANGRVLIVGGDLQSEIFDPTTDTFAVTGNALYNHWQHTATLLPDGRVLLVGCTGGGDSEVYSPSSGSFSDAGSRPGRQQHDRCRATATQLADGRVLIAGGTNRTGAVCDSSAEIYDPVAQAFSTTGPMVEARREHAAARLPGGLVLITGGLGCDGEPLSSAEIYDPATGRFSATGSLNQPRARHEAVALPTGSVIVIGGWAITVVEVFRFGS